METATPPNRAAEESFIDSRFFIGLSRVLMIAAAAIGLPIAGFLMSRIIAQADAISSKLDKSATKIELIEQSVKMGFDGARKDMDRLEFMARDHEGRLRVIERVHTPPPPSRTP